MTKNVAKTVGLVMAITLVSRLMALLSNQVFMTRFGVNTYMDIYVYAVNFQLYTINCVGTMLITVMIPVFAGLIGTGEKKRAFKFADNVISISFVLAGVMSLAGIFLAPYIVRFTRFDDPQYFGFAVAALRIMFPVLIFYTLTYTLQGILQSQHRFFMPAFVSVPSSLIVILYVLMLGKRFGVQGLLIATLIGLSSQAIMLIPAVYKTEYKFFPSFGLRDRDFTDALRLVPPILVSSSAYQINMIFNISMAANFKDTVSLVNVAQQLVIVAILSMAISMTSVMFPRLTTLAASNNTTEFKQTVLKILKTMIYLLIPMTVGLAAVRNETISFIYGYGKFTHDNIVVAAKILSLYAIGGVGLGIKEVVDKAFYSLKDTRKPAMIGVVMMVFNVTFSLVLINYTGMGVYAIPAAYSIAALAGSFTGIYMLRRKIGPFGVTDLLKTTAKVVISAMAMAAVVIPLTMLLGSFNIQLGMINNTVNMAFTNAVKLIVPVLAGSGVFFACTLALKVEEAVEVINKVKGKIFRQYKLGVVEK